MRLAANLEEESRAPFVCTPFPGDGRRPGPSGPQRVVEVAAAVEVSEATVYRWIRQDRIDRGELAGTSTGDNAELRAARQRIAELESELTIVKRASALFDEGRVVRPKTLFGIVATLE